MSTREGIILRNWNQLGESRWIRDPAGSVSRHQGFDQKIDDIIENKQELEEMGRLASSIAPSNVEEKIYEEVLKVLNKGG